MHIGRTKRNCRLTLPRSTPGTRRFTRGYRLTGEDKIRRETIMRVMCDLSLDYAAMSQKLGVNFDANILRTNSRRWNHLKPTDVNHFSPDGFEVTDTGRLFIRNLAMCFDSTLASASERKHSKTI